jgi:pilus assembly protein TadC
MTTTEDLLVELDGIWLVTLRADRQQRIEAIFIAVAALTSGMLLVLGLAYVYTSLARLP